MYPTHSALRRARLALLVLAGTAWLFACSGGSSGGGSNPPPTTTDTTAPTVPGGLTASAQSSSQVLVSWEASSDAGTGVAGYHVFRDGVSTPIATVNDATSYTDTGLTANTQYRYNVTAFDSATPANESSQSGSVLVTTAAGPPPAGELKLTAEPAFASLPAINALVLALQAPGDASTWYAVQQSGRVVAFDNNPGVSSTRTFIDISHRVKFDGEAGLLGMAFHPAYPTDPRVYLSYTSQVGADLVSRVSEFRTTNGGSTLDPSSETILFTITQPAFNHNGGNVAFGPDGLLYVGFGDGGSGDDPWGPIGNGQNVQTLLGKFVRINVDGTTGSVPYRIPPDNPYSSSPLCNHGESTASQPCPEIYAYGFRNPWRWSFDAVTGDLWVGDVGQSDLEEVDRVTNGGNYGWRCYEGTEVHNLDCGPNADTSLPPIAQYTHNAGRAVTGGYVYRGTSIPALAGRYVFGDFGSGLLWHIARDTQPTENVTVSSAAGDTGLAISSFARDVNGELFVLDYGGTIYRLVETDSP